MTFGLWLAIVGGLLIGLGIPIPFGACPSTPEVGLVLLGTVFVTDGIYIMIQGWIKREKRNHE